MWYIEEGALPIFCLHMNGCSVVYLHVSSSGGLRHLPSCIISYLDSLTPMMGEHVKLRIPLNTIRGHFVVTSELGIQR